MSTDNNQNSPQTEKCSDCDKDKDTITQKNIIRERAKICNLLYEASGKVTEQEARVNGETSILEFRKCLFVHTEENYRLYRNFEIITGTELLQVVDSTKSNVDELKKWNNDLGGILKNLVKLLKDTKAKFGELKDAACKLDSNILDKCNSAQWKALTGKTIDEKCGNGETSDDCKETSSRFCQLVSMPNGLSRDIDSISQASSDVMGIQIFSNVETLEPLQKKLQENAKTFEKSISDNMKNREAELKKLQEELIKSVKAWTVANLDRNTRRSSFEGLKDAVDIICCPGCGCVLTDNEVTTGKKYEECKNQCVPRLTECEECICKICKETKQSFCCDPNTPNTDCGE